MTISVTTPISRASKPRAVFSRNIIGDGGAAEVPRQWGPQAGSDGLSFNTAWHRFSDEARQHVDDFPEVVITCSTLRMWNVTRHTLRKRLILFGCDGVTPFLQYARHAASSWAR